jgi:hypothetical protein
MFHTNFMCDDDPIWFIFFEWMGQPSISLCFSNLLLEYINYITTLLEYIVCFFMPTSVLVWIPQKNLELDPQDRLSDTFSSTSFFDGQRRQGFQWPLAKVDPALAAVLELGLSEEPAEAAPAELSEAGVFYDTYDISCLSLPNIQRPLLHLC